MKCLLYAQPPKGRQDLASDYLGGMRTYAQLHSWDIVGFTSDEDADVSCANKADIRNLRRCLDKQKDLDVVIAAVNPILTLANYAALKEVIDERGIDLVIWSSRRNGPTKPTA